MLWIPWTVNHFLPFEGLHQWLELTACFTSSPDHSSTGIKLEQVKSQNKVNKTLLTTHCYFWCETHLFIFYFILLIRIVTIVYFNTTLKISVAVLKRNCKRLTHLHKKQYPVLWQNRLLAPGVAIPPFFWLVADKGRVLHLLSHVVHREVIYFLQLINDLQVI